MSSAFSLSGSGTQDQIKRGDDLLADDKLAEAFAAFQAAVQSHPENSIAHQRLGRMYALRKDLGQASKELNKAISLDANNATAHVDLGWVYGMQGSFQSSISEERLAISIDPRNFSGYLNLGVGLTHENETEAAMRAFQTALSIEPEDEDALINLASLLARQGQYDEAIKLYKHALALDNTNANAHLGLGSALGRVGDRKNELLELQRATALAPKNPNAHGKLGWALYHSGDVQGAALEGMVANGLRVRKASSEFVGTLLIVLGILVAAAIAIFCGIVFGARFQPRSDEKLIKSFFLVFYNNKAGRFFITNRRLVFSPEFISQWFGATRLSFDYVDVETFHGVKAMRGGQMSLLCTNGTVYHFEMPLLVMEPLLEELGKIQFGAQEEKVEQVEYNASQIRLMAVKKESDKLMEAIEGRHILDKPDKPDKIEGTIVTVVDLPDKFKGVEHADSFDGDL